MGRAVEEEGKEDGLLVSIYNWCVFHLLQCLIHLANSMGYQVYELTRIHRCMHNLLHCSHFTNAYTTCYVTLLMFHQCIHNMLSHTACACTTSAHAPYHTLYLVQEFFEIEAV